MTDSRNSVLMPASAPLVDIPPYPLSGYGLLAASADPMICQAVGGAIGGNQLWYTRIWIPAGTVITNLWAAVHTGGTWDTLTTPNQIGLYTDTGAKVDNTSDDGTLWTVAGWRGGALSLGPVTAQSTGRFVYIVWLVRGMTGLVMAFPASAADTNASYLSTGLIGSTNRRAAYSTGTALPASFTPTTVGTSTGSLSLVGVS